MPSISKFRFLLCSMALCSIAVFAFAVEPSATLFENSDVKVTRALEKAHVKGSFHEHKSNRVMVYLQAGRQRFEYQDGRQPATFDWKPGQVVWSPSEGMHSPEVVSDEPFNIVEVELKKPGTGKGETGKRDALRLDGKHFRTEFENDQVRVFRVTLGAHEATPMLEETHNTLAVFLTDQEVRTTDSKGAVGSPRHKAGDVLWESPYTRRMENTGNAPVETILIEVRD